ncbi:MAG: site-specific integrase [Propionibacteriaceae bacterium]|nr:site-specific integrase [Propionibacteriaceae bacterium]
MAHIAKRVSKVTGKVVSWVVRYRTPEGKTREKAFQRKKDAENWLVSTEATKLVGDFVDPHKSTIAVKVWADTWIASKTSLAATTRARYEDIVRAYIKPRWGNLALSKVTHEDIQAWVAGLDLAPASVRKVHRVLSLMLGYAVKSGRLAKNPAKGIDLPHVQSKEKRFLTHAQVEVFAREVGPNWSLVVRFLAYTGLRFGELAALRWRNMDLLRRRAIINQSVSPVNGKMVFSDTKGHGRREVPIQKFLIADLTMLMEGKGPNDLVFTGPSGAILRAQTLSQTAFPRASKALGICEPKLDNEGQPIKDTKGSIVLTNFLTPHELRHTAASLAIASGADVKVVQKMLGHKSATMTLDLYGHLFPDRLDVVADAMEDARTAALSMSCVDGALTSSEKNTSSIPSTTITAI